MADTNSGLLESWSKDYAAGLTLALQQKQSKLTQHITMLGGASGEAAQPVDHIEPFDLDDIDDEAGDTKLGDANAIPRWVFPRSKAKGIRIRRADALYSLSDPSNAIVMSSVAAANRAVDDIILDAMFRSVTIGKNMDRTIDFPAEHTIDAGLGGAGSGMNRAKIDRGMRIMEEAEVELENERPRIGITPGQHELLRNVSEVKNEDFKKMGGKIENGRVIEFLGCMIVVSTRVKRTAAGLVRCPMWVPSGVGLKSWDHVVGRIQERPDKNNTKQAWTAIYKGAVRLEEGRVVEILCAETAIGT